MEIMKRKKRKGRKEREVKVSLKGEKAAMTLKAAGWTRGENRTEIIIQILLALQSQCLKGPLELDIRMFFFSFSACHRCALVLVYMGHYALYFWLSCLT